VDVGIHLAKPLAQAEALGRHVGRYLDTTTMQVEVNEIRRMSSDEGKGVTFIRTAAIRVNKPIFVDSINILRC